MKFATKILAGLFISVFLGCSGGSVDDRSSGINDAEQNPPRIEGVVGDFNKDGKVNESDLLIFRQIYDHYPQGCGADSDCDGQVDGSDFLTWQRKVGTRIYKAGDIDQNGEITMEDLNRYVKDPTAVNVDLDR